MRKRFTDKVREVVTGEVMPTQEPERQYISFDPRDGRKRVLITVDTDGSFAPLAYFGMDERAPLHEAGMIAAHGALIVAENIARLEVTPRETREQGASSE